MADPKKRLVKVFKTDIEKFVEEYFNAYPCPFLLRDLARLFMMHSGVPNSIHSHRDKLDYLFRDGQFQWPSYEG